MTALNAISSDARHVLLQAMVSVAWIDSEFADVEKRAARAAALSLGLVLPEDEVKLCEIEALAVEGLSIRDRELIYLCASWMALADDVELASEAHILSRLRLVLELTQERSADLHKLAEGVAPPAEDGAWWHCFDDLVVRAAKSLG